MTLWHSSELAAALGGTMTRPFNAAGISIDSRSLRPGELFFALRGETADGHDHVAAALAAGAAGVVVHRADGLPRNAPAIIVGETGLALRRLGRAGRDRFAGRLVAITGSVGKTSSKEMLRDILATAGPTHAAAASHNNHLGVPLTLASIPRDAAFAVVEIGTNHRGEIANLARLARPHVAIITAIGAAHIGHFGSLEAIADEKASLLGFLETEPEGVAILPGDIALAARLPRFLPQGRVVWFGEHAGADAQLVAAEMDATGSAITARIAGRTISFRLGAPGRHMARNAVAALAAAAELGVDIGTGAAALAAFRPLAGRGALLPLLGGAATLLDESYNASTASMEAAIALLRLVPARRRIAVLGDMLELGAHARAEHESLAASLAESADLLFACGPLMRHLFEAMPLARRGAHAEESAALAPQVAAALAPGDAVLVKGSLGSRMKIVVQALHDVPAPDAAPLSPATPVSH